MKSHIVMVHFLRGATVSYSHGLASLAARLIESGTKSREIVLHKVKTEHFYNEAEEILNLNPYVVLLTCTSNQWNDVREIAAILKEKASEIPLCVGGPHMSSVHDLNALPFDIGVTGEAEDIIAALVRVSVRGIPALKQFSLGLRKSRKIYQNLDELPYPYLGIFDKSDILEYPSVMFSRGCPYECSYCMSRKGGFCGIVRWKSPQRAIREVLQLTAYIQPDELYIDDDTFLKNPEWVKRFCKLYNKKIEVPFYCNTRPETITPELVYHLKEANCAAIGIGIESGSHRIRREILRRGMSNREIIRSFDVAHRAGLKTWSFNMIGIPTETIEDLHATIELNEIIQADFVRISIFTPYPHTPIHDLAYASGYNGGYSRNLGDLPKELQAACHNWVARLATEGRLWCTTAERSQFFH